MGTASSKPKNQNLLNEMKSISIIVFKLNSLYFYFQCSKNQLLNQLQSICFTKTVFKSSTNYSINAIWLGFGYAKLHLCPEAKGRCSNNITATKLKLTATKLKQVHAFSTAMKTRLGKVPLELRVLNIPFPAKMNNVIFFKDSISFEQ